MGFYSPSSAQGEITLIKGKFTDGTVFNSSFERGDPIEYDLVIEVKSSGAVSTKKINREALGSAKHNGNTENLFVTTFAETEKALSDESHLSEELTCSASLGTINLALSGVVFQPFEEVKKAELEIPITPQVLLARQKYEDKCEGTINVEYTVSYVYHSLCACFDRDNVALKGLAK
ncbi:Ferritin [Corchorus olitorius]|uniref:Ferritin n=1 Tax=Corchorus olitorius TaxID=93759 RepID=A0A1R3KUU4_9ROSI|nr:Ferritin [Corchorus olitorius]